MTNPDNVLLDAAKRRRDDLVQSVEAIGSRLEQIRQAKAMEVELRKNLAKLEDELETLSEALGEE